MPKIRLISSMLALSFPLAGIAADRTLSREGPAPPCDDNPPSFDLVRQTASLPPPGPLVAGYVYADDFEGASPLVLWSNVFGSDFPSRPSSNAQITIEAGKFVALEFNTMGSGDPIYAGSLFGQLQVFPSIVSTQLALSISNCPGSFVHVRPGCVVSVGQGSFPWMLDGILPGACTLIEYTGYYLNLAHVDRNTGLNTCSESDARCEVDIEAR
jgi:hypothetical protein